MMHTAIQPKKEMVWTIREILNWTTKRFADSGIETPLLDAQLLLGHVLNLTKVQLYIQIDKPLNDLERKSYRELVYKRLQGTPVAYLLQKKYWHELELFVDERVLIPRPETETLLDFTLQYLKLRNIVPKFIFDFCTGSGCLAIALAKKFPSATVVGIDLSSAALEVAQKNAVLNNVENIIWLNLNANDEETYSYLRKEFGSAEVIVANPPYVSIEEWENLDLTVKNYEPKMALVCEDTGLKIGKNIFNYIDKYELLNKAEYVFAMELADKQPQKLVNYEINNYNINFPIWDFPNNCYFSLSDLEDKNRFLININYCLKNFS